jgi:hypothetical protein
MDAHQTIHPLVIIDEAIFIAYMIGHCPGSEQGVIGVGNFLYDVQKFLYRHISTALEIPRLRVVTAGTTMSAASTID